MNETERFWHLARLRINEINRLIAAAELEARAELSARHGGIYAEMIAAQAKRNT